MGLLLTQNWSRMLLWQICFCGSLNLAAPASAREWVDNTGHYRVEAEFLRLAESQVHLRKADGKVIAVPLNRLSEQDLQELRKLIVESAKPEPAPLKEEKPEIEVTRPTLAATSDSHPSTSSGKLVSVLEHQGQTPDRTIRSVMSALAEHQPRAVWDALPRSYQADVEALLPAYAKQIDAELWQAAVPVLRKSIRVIHRQRTFLREHPVVKLSLTEPTSQAEATVETTNAENNLAAADESWDALVAALVTIAKSDLADREKLLTLSPGEFLDTTGSQVMQQLSVASKHSAQDDFNQMLFLLSQMKVSLVSEEGETAVVRLESAGQTEDNEMVRIEGKWIPADLAVLWPMVMGEAKRGLAWLELSAQSGQRQQWLSTLHRAEAELDQLLVAQTQTEFNQALATLLSLLQRTSLASDPAPSLSLN